jgi:hypothetical protein
MWRLIFQNDISPHLNCYCCYLEIVTQEVGEARNVVRVAEMANMHVERRRRLLGRVVADQESNQPVALQLDEPVLPLVARRDRNLHPGRICSINIIVRSSFDYDGRR